MLGDKRRVPSTRDPTDSGMCSFVMMKQNRHLQRTTLMGATHVVVKRERDLELK